MLINEYLRMLYIKHIPKKVFKFIDNIAIYTENRKVYKVILRYTHRSCNQLRKLKIYTPFKYINNPPVEEITDDIILKDNHPRLTIIFDKKSGTSNITVGELFKTMAPQ